MDADPLPPELDKDASRRSMERFVRLFVPRSVFARRFGIFGASMLPLGSAYGGKIPSGVKVACVIDGELKEVRYGETTHREISQREAIPGSVIVEGFSLPNETSPVADANE
jgi:hypothetical protein